ncbi:ribonuclease H-like domain-containing protein, partial [Tanacetum coccineum]
MDNVRPRGSCSPSKRSYYTKPAFRPKDLKQEVKTFGVQNMTTAGVLSSILILVSGSFMLKKVEAIQRSYMKISMETLWLLEGPKGDELKFNLFFVSQMCDKKNSVLFTESECLILSPSFKLLDESQVVLRAPRKDDVYSLDLKNIVPSGGLEKQLNHNVKIIRCDNGTEFKNHVMNEFCAKKGIKREFSVARTLQQNGVAERKNRTLIKAARTMLADSLLPIPFWAEAVNTACYVLNRVLVTKPQNKTPYELLIGSSGKDKGPTQEYILLSLQPHRTRIPVEDVPPAAHEKPSESSPKENDVQDSEDVANKESEQDLQDELEKMKTTQATSTNKLSTDRPYVSTDRPPVSTDRSYVSTDRPSVSTDRPFVSTDRSNTPYVSAASTSTGVNAGESSFVYLEGKIPIDASTLPNDDLP